MEITIEKLTDVNLLRKACEATIRSKSNITLKEIYKNEHSPIRTQIFWITMKDIPIFVSTHFVRHKIGVEHYILSHRTDRGGAGDNVVTRDTLTTHSMFINAQALINMARKRLCLKASRETRFVMNEIRNKITSVDPDLTDFLVPECCYRGRCPESKSCGKIKEQFNLFKGDI